LLCVWSPSVTAAATPEVSVTTFRTGVTSLSSSITAGPDGNLWFTEVNSKVGRITPAGVVTEFSSGFSRFLRSSITAGPDGNLWFTGGGPLINRITPAGVATEFSGGITGNPTIITAGPDGNLWFTEGPHYLGGASLIGRITPAGVVAEFPVGVSNEPFDITAGPDGNLWFTDSGEIGRITPAGTMTKFSKGMGEPLGITAGPDGNVWFTEQGPPAAIGRIKPTGAVTKFSKGITGRPTAIAKGPDGNLWFTEFSAKQGASPAIGRITPKGVVTEYQKGITGQILDITRGPGQTVWFSANHYIGRIQIGGKSPGSRSGSSESSLVCPAPGFQYPAIPKGEEVTYVAGKCVRYAPPSDGQIACGFPLYPAVPAAYVVTEIRRETKCGEGGFGGKFPHKENAVRIDHPRSGMVVCGFLLYPKTPPGYVRTTKIKTDKCGEDQAELLGYNAVRIEKKPG
jgi:streptogramin lyase